MIGCSQLKISKNTFLKGICINKENYKKPKHISYTKSESKKGLVLYH